MIGTKRIGTSWGCLLFFLSVIFVLPSISVFADGLVLHNSAIYSVKDRTIIKIYNGIEDVIYSSECKLITDLSLYDNALYFLEGYYEGVRIRKLDLRSGSIDTIEPPFLDEYRSWDEFYLIEIYEIVRDNEILVQAKSLETYVSIIFVYNLSKEEVTIIHEGDADVLDVNSNRGMVFRESKLNNPQVYHYDFSSSLVTDVPYLSGYDWFSFAGPLGSYIGFNLMGNAKSNTVVIFSDEPVVLRRSKYYFSKYIGDDLFALYYDRGLFDIVKSRDLIGAIGVLE